MTDPHPLGYRDTGVVDSAEMGLRGLLGWVARTAAFRHGRAGRPALDVGFFASVVDIGHGLGLALCTDGVGSKVLVAEMLERYDTIGIDCVAMNVNDAICVGAEPISFLDYIAIERATPAVLEAIARGMHEGARQAGVTIVGGEISQVPELIRGVAPGRGLDLVGMCAGLVRLDRIVVGREIRPGDVVVGVRSSGIHSNGLTLARRVLFDHARLRPDESVAELGTSVGDELLRPTLIYVAPVLELLERGVPVRGLAHITGDGFLNLARLDAPIGYELDALPPVPPIFRLIADAGRVAPAEMYRVFNMGIGFCLVVPDEPVVVDAVVGGLTRHGFAASRIGRAVADPRRRVTLTAQGLVGEGDGFTSA